MCLSPDSHLRRILGSDELTINSLHHAVVWAPDSVIEAIESTNGRFLIGVQCHLEAPQSEIDPHWRVLFRSFIQSKITAEDDLSITSVPESKPFVEASGVAVVRLGVEREPLRTNGGGVGYHLVQ